MKRKYFNILFFIGIMFTFFIGFKVNALSLSDGTVLPDFPEDNFSDYLIYKSPSAGNITLVKYNFSDFNENGITVNVPVFNSCSSLPCKSTFFIYNKIEGSNTFSYGENSLYILDVANNVWVTRSSFNYFSNFSTNTILATNQKIYGFSNEYIVLFEPNYGLNLLPENSIISIGNNTYGINSNKIKINTITGGKSISCLGDREFNNEYCYYYYDDIVNNSDLSNKIVSTFSLSDNSNESLPILSGKYYSLTYRILNTSEIKPSALSYTTGNLSASAYIIDTYSRSNGIYTDYVLIFRMNDTNFEGDHSYQIDTISLIFPNFEKLGDIYNESFELPIFRTYKYQQHDHIPTLVEIDYIFNINSLDSINSNTNSDDESFFTKSINYFIEPIKSVFVYISIFYEGLPIELKYTLIAVLTISSSLIIIKFIL